MALKEVEFTVLITFDITVDGRTDVYAEVTKHLADSGFAKESPSGATFPENIYYGVKKRPVEFDDEGNTTVGELKAATESINSRVVEILDLIFESADVQNKILVHVGRKATSTTVMK